MALAILSEAFAELLHVLLFTAPLGLLKTCNIGWTIVVAWVSCSDVFEEKICWQPEQMATSVLAFYISWTAFSSKTLETGQGQVYWLSWPPSRAMLVVPCQILVNQQETILSLILIAFCILAHLMHGCRDRGLYVELNSALVKTCVGNEGGFGDWHRIKD